jgi:phosphotriesterase-related protein
MTMVPSVGDEVPESGMGQVLVHEHLVRGLLGHEYFTLAGAPAAEPDALAAALSGLAAAGIETIVDATTIGAGRDVELLRAVARKSGVRIVCSTGLDVADAEATGFGTLDADGIAEVFTRELSAGIPGSDARAGALVLGLGAEAHPFDEALTLAVAFAYAETGAPVLARAGTARDVLWQVERLMARGVDPERLVALHLDRPSTSWETLDAIASTGARLGFTRIGHDDLHEDARAAMVAYAIRRHGADRLCLSMSSWGGWLGPTPAPEIEPERGFGFLDGFLERLRGLGVSAGELETLLTTTPQALFAR